MPQIPIQTRPDIGFSAPIGQQASASGWSSLPSNMASFAQSGIADMIGGIGTAVGAIGGAIGEYGKKIQDAKDYNAIAEARRLARVAYETHQTDIRNRVDYENFDKSLENVNKNVEEQIKPLLGDASSHAQMVIQNDIADMASGTGILTKATSTQMHVSQMRNNTEDRIKYYSSVGQYDHAKAEFDGGVSVGLFHENDRGRVFQGIDEMQTFNQVRGAMDNAPDPFKVAEINSKLKEVDDDGNFVNWQNLPLSQRMDFIKHGNVKSNQLEAQIKDDVMSQFLEGKRVEDKTINALPIDQKLKNSLLSMGKQMDKRILAEKESAVKEGNKKIHDDIYLKFSTMPWSTNDADRTAMFNKLGSEVLTRSDIDSQQKQSLYGHLKALYNESSKPGSYTTNDVYKFINQKLKKAYDNSELYGHKDRTMFGWSSEDSSEDVMDANYVNLQQNWDTFFKKNQNISVEQANTWYKNNVSQANEGKLKRILSERFMPLATRQDKPIFNAFEREAK
jgi:hypothetical protein